MASRWALAGALALTACTAPAATTVTASNSPSSPASLAATATAQPPNATASSAEPAPDSGSEDEPGTALAALGSLEVKGRAPKTSYDRDLFGQRWADTDRNGCDTRNDILRRDLTAVTFEPGTRDCVVIAGTLAEPYTGQTLTFAKADADAVHIDHVVALSDAWQKGAQQWEPGKRLAFANDPLNLLAVDGPTNASKSDGDAATWLPPNKAYRCPMVARQVAVKVRYDLWVTAAERDAIARVLSACPNEPAPASNAAAVVEPTAPAPPPAPTAAPAPPAPTGTDPNYGTCANAKAHGAGPYVGGQDPEYSFYRDGDSDGTVCE